MTSNTIDKFLDIVKKQIKEYPNLSVSLKRDKVKGVGLYANKDIKKGDLIAYYKITCFKKSNYKSPTNDVYSFEVLRKNGEGYKSLIGDIDESSFRPPIDGITFWGPFANEPSEHQTVNAEIYRNINGNYKDRKRNYLIEGDDYIYKLAASKDIKAGEEILWYYGESYSRDYELGKIK